jgi:hypothetical protein
MDNNPLNKVVLAAFIAEAILNDYANLASKIENTPVDQIKDRIYNEAEKLRKEFAEIIPRNAT